MQTYLINNYSTIYRDKPHLFAADFPAAGAAPEGSGSDGVARPAVTEEPPGAKGGDQPLEEHPSPPPTPPQPPGAGDEQLSGSQAGQLLSPMAASSGCSSFGQLPGAALTGSSPAAQLEAQGSERVRIRKPPSSGPALHLEGGGDGQYADMEWSRDGETGLLPQLLVAERARLGLPPVQPLLKLLNSSMTVCYANGVTNILLSTPLLVRFFLALSSPHPLVLALQGLCQKDPSTPASLDRLRSSLADILPRYHFFRQTRQQQDGMEFLSALIEALQIVITSEERTQLRWLLLIGTDQLLRCTSQACRASSGSTWLSSFPWPTTAGLSGLSSYQASSLKQCVNDFYSPF